MRPDRLVQWSPYSSLRKLAASNWYLSAKDHELVWKFVNATAVKLYSCTYTHGHSVILRTTTIIIMRVDLADKVLAEQLACPAGQPCLYMEEI
jgi:DNA-binding GntR family transcriptional regulator